VQKTQRAQARRLTGLAEDKQALEAQIAMYQNGGKALLLVFCSMMVLAYAMLA